MKNRSLHVTFVEEPQQSVFSLFDARRSSAHLVVDYAIND